MSALSKIDFADGIEVDADEIQSFDLAPNNPFVVFVNGVFNEGASRLVDGIELRDRKSTRLNSSHALISYAVFCLKKKNNISTNRRSEEHTPELYHS